MKITTLLLDLGNVLVINHPEWAANKFSGLNGRSVAENMKIMEDHIDYMEGRMTPSQFAQKYINLMNLNISEQEFHDIHADIFSLNEPLFNFLKKVKRMITLTMLSNTEAPTIEFLKKKYPRLFSLFGGRLALSFLEEVGSVKPKKEIYFYALRVSNSEPENTVFFDDKIEYVEAGKGLGLHAFQYKTVKKLRDDLASLGVDMV